MIFNSSSTMAVISGRKRMRERERDAEKRAERAAKKKRETQKKKGGKEIERQK